jgi:predicted DNA-binding protein
VVYANTAGATDVGKKKISTTIYLTQEQQEKLKQLHERTSVPMSVFIRDGIDLVLEKHADKINDQTALDFDG